MTRGLVPFVVAAMFAACWGAPAAPTPSPTPSPAPSPGSGSDFYLRAWYTQALPPAASFNWLPIVTIVEGTLIDGNVAVPAIYPGPLLISPNARWISETGVAAVVDVAQRLGMLGDVTDFGGGDSLPGARVGHIEIVIDGNRRLLTGDPDAMLRCDGARCAAEPGTPGAFAAYWQELANAGAWLEPELGPLVAYEPERVALLLTEPTAGEPDLTPAPITWPFETPLDAAGVAYPGTQGDRCLTMATDELEAILPALRSGNQLTTFVDQAGNQRGLMVRVLVPGEESPCQVA